MLQHSHHRCSTIHSTFDVVLVDVLRTQLRRLEALPSRSGSLPHTLSFLATHFWSAFKTLAKPNRRRGHYPKMTSVNSSVVLQSKNEEPHIGTDRTQPESNPALKLARHELEIARIDLFLLKQRIQERLETSAEFIKRMDVAIENNPDPTGMLLTAKRSVEQALRISLVTWKLRIAGHQITLRARIRRVEWLKATTPWEKTMWYLKILVEWGKDKIMGRLIVVKNWVFLAVVYCIAVGVCGLSLMSWANYSY